MATKLNQKAFNHAQQLVKQGKVVRDERDAWSDHPSADKEDEFIRLHGLDEYGKWHLRTDEEESENTKKSRVPPHHKTEDGLLTVDPPSFVRFL